MADHGHGGGHSGGGHSESAGGGGKLGKFLFAFLLLIAAINMFGGKPNMQAQAQALGVSGGVAVGVVPGGNYYAPMPTAPQYEREYERESAGNGFGRRNFGPPVPRSDYQYVRPGGCGSKEEVFVRGRLTCREYVTDTALLEQQRGKISDICRGEHGKVKRNGPQGPLFYLCP